jgi:hypothetical protein
MLAQGLSGALARDGWDIMALAYAIASFDCRLLAGAVSLAKSSCIVSAPVAAVERWQSFVGGVDNEAST